MKLKSLSLLSFLLSMAIFKCFSQSINLELDPALKNQMTITESPVGTFDITTSGIDPWVQTKPVANYNPDNVFVVSFEYLAPNGLDDLEIFYGALSTARTVKLGSLPKTTNFTTYKVMMKFVAPIWDSFYDRFRFDFGKQAGQNIKVRNVVIRTALPQEVINLDLDLNLKNQMNITKKADNSFDINTTGVDPWVVAEIKTTFNPEKVYVIGFDYIATAGLDNLEIFYGTPIATTRKANLGGLSATATYKNFKTLMRMSAPVWNASYDQLRFDFGKQAGQALNVKNIVLREATAEENALIGIKDSVEIKLDVTRTSPSLSATLLPDGSFQLNTSGNDPWIQSLPITDLYNISETYIISFDYKTSTAYNDLEIFYGPPINSSQAGSFGALPAASNWTSLAINPRLSVDNFQDALRTLFRFDFGKNEGQSKTIFIKNLQLRKPTPQEIAEELKTDRFLSTKLNNDFLAYLSNNYTDSISMVKINTATADIKGTISGTESEYFLAELEPHNYDFDINKFSSISRLTIINGKFNISLARFVAKSDRNYDRLYSRWAVVKKISDNNYALLSNPTWAGDISAIAQHNLVEKKATTKKGLDGLGGSSFQWFSELPVMGIKSMKINILLNGLLSLNPTSLTHNFNGKNYFINPNFISQFDNSIKACKENDILVSLVVLIPINITNETLRRIFAHPDASKGLYSMANVATEEGVEYYTAMIDFLAQRYSRPDNQFGRVDHYIIHNEVDAHESWTHAGDKPAPLYTEIYQRSLRAVHYTIRKYDPTAKVFLSFTKHFNSRVNKESFLSKEILDVMGKLSKKEGDFEWGIGWHSYPTDLFNPKVWNDDPAQTALNFNALQITPKNIEVIDAYVRQKSVLYNGKKVRTVILSENGFSSNGARNPNANETTQAAALAYFWKKTNNRVPAIEGIQLHRWIDNTQEAGLLFGLWTNKPGTVSDLGDKKEGWSVWNAAGTPAENAVFEKYKAVIGINDWADINQSMVTEVTPYQVNMSLSGCNGNLNELTVFFNGEIKRPQENATIVFYNVASNVLQPYEVYKGNTLLKKGVLNVSGDLNIEIALAPVYEFMGKALSPVENKLSWKADPALSGYVIEAKFDNANFQELARVNNTNATYLHQGLIAGKEYTYRIAGLVNGILSCYSNEVVINITVAQFTTNNLVVLRVGDGVAINTGSTQPVSLVEFSKTGGTAVTTTTIGSDAAGSRLTINDNAATEGILKLSADKVFLSIGGYDLGPGIGAATAIGAAKLVVRIGANGIPDYSTKLTAGTLLGNFRAALSQNGTSFYVSSGNGGVRLVNFGSTGVSTEIARSQGSFINANSLAISNGQLYCGFFNTVNYGVSSIGAGIPTTTGQTPTSLPGVAVNGRTQDFIFFDLDATVAGDDVLYVSENTDLVKYSLVSGTWTQSSRTGLGNVGYGLTGYVNANNKVELFFTTGAVTENNKLQTVIDANGYNTALSGSISDLASAGTGYAFRGVAFTPGSNLPTTLPVSLIDFNGKSTADGVQLNWTTSSELNNDRFDVLRSDDTNNFQIITSVKGKGTSNQINTYGYLDVVPLFGTNYYKLSQVDYNGKSTLSKIVAVKTGLTKTELEIYATGEYLLYKVNAIAAGTTKLEVFDINGKVILNESTFVNAGFNNNNLSIAGLKPGVYIAKLSISNQLLSKKFIKQ